MERICKKCLIRDLAVEDYTRLKTYMDAIKEADRVSDEEYEKRLKVCRTCESLNAGTCGACGCYVELRALGKMGNCPHKKW